MQVEMEKVAWTAIPHIVRPLADDGEYPVDVEDDYASKSDAEIRELMMPDNPKPVRGAAYRTFAARLHDPDYEFEVDEPMDGQRGVTERRYAP